MSSVCVADVVRQERLRWFGHLEHIGKNLWVSACSNVFVTGARGISRGTKT